MKNVACRVAFAAFLHDLGKLAERARMEVTDDALNIHKQLYCHRVNHPDGSLNYYTHIHAAYTALAWDTIEQHLPDLVRGDVAPFVRTPSCNGSSPPPTASPPASSATHSLHTTTRATIVLRTKR